MKNRFLKFTAVALAMNLLTEVVFPSVAWALTSGPSQPEVQSFEPVGTSEMVDVFSGDFVYNIPLLDVGGYPVNISYHGGITMDQEASWVGLGWNINPGVINRNMRGLPDDFDGSKDMITKELNIRPNRTYGVNGSMQLELLGKENSKKLKVALSLGMGISYNNYKGFGMSQSASPSISVSTPGKTKLTAGLGLNSSSSEGLDVSPNLSFEATEAETDIGKNLNIGCPSLGASTIFNSRTGLKALTLDFSIKYEKVNSKNKKQSGTIPLINGGSPITFGTPTYIPEISTPMVNASVLLSSKFMGEFVGLEAGYGLSGYYSEQKINPDFKTQQVPAYGYLYSEKANAVSLQDFNREKDASFSLNTPALPLTNYTYDVYAVSGQGVGGMYRPYRSEVGMLYDRSNSSTSESYSLGLEFGGGNMVKFGADIAITDVYSRSGKWVNHNPLSSVLAFRKKGATESAYEPVYFKQAGEKSVDAEYEDPNSFYVKAGEGDPVRASLVKQGGLEVGTEGTLKKFKVSSSGVSVEPVSNNAGGEIVRNRNKRQKRNENISILKVNECRNFAIDNSVFNTTDPVKRVSANAKDHHIGEITALRADGSRYVYGLPAYNTLQKEVSFSVGKGTKNSAKHLTPDYATGLVTYNHNLVDGDNSMENKHGLDNYFSSVTTPAYAHSYLLTSVLSADYVDNDGIPGPTTGDMGSYTKFNYEKINAGGSNYRWRVPVGTNQANSNEGLNTVIIDDQANYIYGEKEVWYLESIENKNYIAIFDKGTRADGLGVTGEEGTVDPNNPLMLLKSIRLYFRDEYLKGYNTQTETTTAVPIKTVHFEYDYSICKGVANNYNNPEQIDANGFPNQGGKLTLKKIFFTYQNSERARFSPYEFTYCDPDHDGVIDDIYNPSYNLKAYDRWGNYKPVNEGFKKNAEFPYVQQDKSLADVYTSAWALTRIDLPSGGYIKVSYESDDYAYVQDRTAMQMFEVKGIYKDVQGAELKNKLYEPGVFGSPNRPLHDQSHYTVLKIDLPVAVADNGEFYRRYLKGIDGQNLFFRFNVNLGEDKYDYFEYVTGYAEIAGYNVIGNSAYIQLKSIGLGEKQDKGLQLNPVTKAALQFSRIYTPQYAFGETDATDSEFSQVFNALLNSNFAKNITETMMGVNRTLLLKGHCSEVQLSKCSIRLLCPDKKKLGGGSRVSEIRISDNASALGMNNDSEYGQSYQYTTTDSETGETISSGVASYEPMIGNEENPFRLPVAFLNNKQEKVLVPDDRFYMEEPFGESFFPAPSVGYSKVTVKSFGRSQSSQDKFATGSIVHEFYTAKDFPVITSRTDLQTLPRKSSRFLRMIKIQSKDYMNASQGYVIELNDMHGKPKAQWVYAEGKKDPISGVRYIYKSEGNRLQNKVPVIDPLGVVREANVGIDFDMVADMREHETESTSVGLHGNLAAFLAALFPGIVPMFIPAYAKERTRFRSAVITKVVQRYGILEETVAYDLGSSVSTRNLAFDSETGEVLLTQTKNDFEDDVYNFTFPAHWAYDRMGQAYKNIGVEYSATFTKGRAIVADPKLFNEGDELILVKNSVLDDPSASPDLRNNKNFRFWIIHKDDNTIHVMGGIPAERGQSPRAVYEPEGVTQFKVIRSGRRNLQNVPVGTVVCLNNPIKDAEGFRNIDLESMNHKILAAGATEFADEWKICECQFPDPRFNPYFEGTKGNWRLKKTYTYLTGRTQAGVMADTRHDGIFTSFTSFWNPPAYGQWIKDENNWRWVTEITAYEPFSGMEIEDEDALKRFSSAKTGHNHSVPLTVSSNAETHEIFFDGFEDTTPDPCNKTFSNDPSNRDKLNLSYSHTGRRSVKVPAGGGPVILGFEDECQDK